MGFLDSIFGKKTGLQQAPKPGDAKSLYKLGCQCYEKGNFAGAIANYTQAIELDADYELAYYNRGLAYACREDYDRVISDMQEAIRLKPNWPEVHYTLGLAYEYKKMDDKAIAAYSKAIDIASKRMKGDRSVLDDADRENLKNIEALGDKLLAEYKGMDGQTMRNAMERREKLMAKKR